MDVIENYMSAISDILESQTEEECRKNVFETIDGLHNMFPKERNRIDKCFRELCIEHNKDFSKVQDKIKTKL